LKKPGIITRLGDFTLLCASPKRYRQQQHFRRMNQDPQYKETWLAAMRAFGYRAAQSKEGSTGWMGSASNADREISQDLPILRSRGRELGRDDPIASGLYRTFVCNIIGTGVKMQGATEDKAKNDAMEAVWKDRKNALYQGDRLTQAEGQRMLIWRWVEDGEVLIKRVITREGEPVWFEIIESDRLSTPVDKQANTKIRDGVERDGFGRPAFYWILKRHPGDLVTGLTGLTSKDYVGVPASAIVHLKTTERPGQTRGVPLLHAVLQDLRDLDLLLLASLKRTQIAACLAAFIESPEETEDIMNVTARKYDYIMDGQLEPGMIYRLHPEEKLSTLIPNFPTPELEGFIIMLARRIGSAVGVSWQTVLRDFSKSTYSSARTDLLETWGTYDVFAKQFIETVLEPQWQVVLIDAILRGDERLNGITSDDMKKVRAIPRGRKWVDPKKEVEAAAIELAIGVTNLRDICAAQGKDWEEVMRQRLIEEKAEMEAREQLGLPPKAAAPDIDANDDDDDEDETGNADQQSAQARLRVA
jgi:lambda family phage portal protein